MIRFSDSVRRLVPLAWPVLVGQLAVLAFGTIDTLLVARHSPADLGAFAVGAAAYITVFVGLMGAVLAVSPVVGQLFGAGRLEAAGDELHQGIWLALGLSLLGCTLLLFPQPFLALSRATPEMEAKVRGYLLALAVALPASLLFTVYRAFNTAVSRPKAVMVLQLAGLGLKLPLSTVLVFGWPAVGVPALGVTGAGLATAAALWLQLLVAAWVLHHDRFYDRFALWGRGLHPPNRAAILGLLRLGVPMGMAVLVEVSAFSFMAFFIARLGTVPVAGHQIAMNLVSLMFMLPLSLANAGSTLVAQRVGAGDLADARRLGWHAMALALISSGVLAGAIYLGRVQVVGLYTGDAAVAAVALSLLSWLVVFHVCDAAQTMAAFVLRAWRVATVPMVIYAGTLWGIGLGLGAQLAFDDGSRVPDALRGAPGFWAAATLALVLCSVFLVGFKAWVLRQRGSQPA
ncbi:MATE family efflux transporter [Ideonella sp. 4Y11]|uniref:Multidrug-efflux transporter n=1 Tax=Ideonella aquatica TaxID=2824119 RepID=A0A941BHD9_9BURK|nr:MATE family efflux transporter [Ideonella aquatica]MBQ0957552.1 MATE family efflux transporter [Ideonella aquatica]